MTWQDLTNGALQAIASLAVWRNAFLIYRDRGYAGNRVSSAIFFTLFGLWSVYYYHTLAQYFSLVCGVSVFFADLVCLALMVRFGRLERNQVVSTLLRDTPLSRAPHSAGRTYPMAP